MDNLKFHVDGIIDLSNDNTTDIEEGKVIDSPFTIYTITYDNQRYEVIITEFIKIQKPTAILTIDGCKQLIKSNISSSTYEILADSSISLLIPLIHNFNVIVILKLVKAEICDYKRIILAMQLQLKELQTEEIVEVFKYPIWKTWDEFTSLPEYKYIDAFINMNNRIKTIPLGTEQVRTDYNHLDFIRIIDEQLPLDDNYNTLTENMPVVVESKMNFESYCNNDDNSIYSTGIASIKFCDLTKTKPKLLKSCNNEVVKYIPEPNSLTHPDQNKRSIGNINLTRDHQHLDDSISLYIKYVVYGWMILNIKLIKQHMNDKGVIQIHIELHIKESNTTHPNVSIIIKRNKKKVIHNIFNNSVLQVTSGKIPTANQAINHYTHTRCITLNYPKTTMFYKGEVSHPFI
jgi:hypothetical protein